MTTMMIAQNEDILRSILVWLPPRLLFRFKLVSKQWRSLISSDHFAHLHTLHHRRRRRIQPSLLLHLLGDIPHRGYYYLNLLTKKLAPYHFPPNLGEPTITISSNGLLLLRCENSAGGEYFVHHYVYNPTTGKSRRIEFRSNEKFPYFRGFTLAFDPSVSVHYKIICFRSKIITAGGYVVPYWIPCEIEVYDSETRVWRLIEKPILVRVDMDFNDGVYLNGCLHGHKWLINLEECVARRHPKLKDPPGMSITERLNYHHGESCGHLYRFLHCWDMNMVMVFELASDFSEWSLKYRVRVDGVPELIAVVDLLRVEMEEEDEEVDALVLCEAGKFMVYSCEQGRSEEIVDFRNEEFYLEGIRQCHPDFSFQFAETLALV